MKKAFILFLLISSLTVTISSQENTIPVGLIYETSKYNNNIFITGYTGNAEILVIPEKIQNLPVALIGSKAFYGNNTLKSVILPPSIITIEQSAFENCSILTNITIPLSVMLIKSYAFHNCNNLIEVTVPKSTKLEKDSFPAITKITYEGERPSWDWLLDRRAQ